MSELSLFTAILIESAMSGIFAIYIYILERTNKNKFAGLMHIMIGFLSFFAGSLLMVLRIFIPSPLYVSILPGNLILLIGMVFLANGLKKLFHIKTSIKLYLPFIFILSAIFYYYAAINDQVAMRMLIVSFSMSILFFEAAYRLYQKVRFEGYPHIIPLIYIIVAYASIFVIRFITTLINYQNINAYLAYTLDTLFQIAGILTFVAMFIDIIVIINKMLAKEVEYKLFENELLIRELESLTKVDYLTGLYNRKHLEQKTEELIKSCTKKQTSFRFVLLDLDGFKAANDLYGHQFGDQILKQFARLLKEYTNNVYRLGGDEFIMLCDQSEKDLQIMIDDLFKRLGELKNPYDYHPNFSYGIHTWISGQTFDDIMHISDQMMYRNKRNGKETH